jgi:hypothetical protein
VNRDLVILAANALYELPSPQHQERCVRLAWLALRRGGYLYVDNNDYKGDWDRIPYPNKRIIFSGEGLDGTFGEWSMESLAFDPERDILHMKRTWTTRTPEGAERNHEYLCSKHPVTAREVQGWLETHGFQIVHVFGDRQGTPYTQETDRAIFWASKP